MPPLCLGKDASLVSRLPLFPLHSPRCSFFLSFLVLFPHFCTHLVPYWCTSYQQLEWLTLSWSFPCKIILFFSPRLISQTITITFLPKFCKESNQILQCLSLSSTHSHYPDNHMDIIFHKSKGETDRLTIPLSYPKTRVYGRLKNKSSLPPASHCLFAYLTTKIRLCFENMSFSLKIVFFFLSACTMVQNNQESRCKYWVTCRSVRLHHLLICLLRTAHFAHAFYRTHLSTHSLNSLIFELVG